MKVAMLGQIPQKRYTMKVAAHHYLSIPVKRCPVLLAVSCVRVTSLKLRGSPDCPACGLRWKSGSPACNVEAVELGSIIKNNWLVVSNMAFMTVISY